MNQTCDYTIKLCLSCSHLYQTRIEPWWGSSRPDQPSQLGIWTNTSYMRKLVLTCMHYEVMWAWIWPQRMWWLDSWSFQIWNCYEQIYFIILLCSFSYLGLCRRVETMSISVIVCQQKDLWAMQIVDNAAPSAAYVLALIFAQVQINSTNVKKKKKTCLAYPKKISCRAKCLCKFPKILDVSPGKPKHSTETQYQISSKTRCPGDSEEDDFEDWTNRVLLLCNADWFEGMASYFPRFFWAVHWQNATAAEIHTSSYRIIPQKRQMSFGLVTTVIRVAGQQELFQHDKPLRKDR